MLSFYETNDFEINENEASIDIKKEENNSLSRAKNSASVPNQKSGFNDEFDDNFASSARMMMASVQGKSTSEAQKVYSKEKNLKPKMGNHTSFTKEKKFSPIGQSFFGSMVSIILTRDKVGQKYGFNSSRGQRIWDESYAAHEESSIGKLETKPSKNVQKAYQNKILVKSQGKGKQDWLIIFQRR